MSICVSPCESGHPIGDIWWDKLDADAAAVCHGQLLSADSQVWLFSCLLGVPHQRKFRKRGWAMLSPARESQRYDSVWPLQYSHSFGKLNSKRGRATLLITQACSCPDKQLGINWGLNHGCTNMYKQHLCNWRYIEWASARVPPTPPIWGVLQREGERWMDGWMDGWVGGWVDGWMDG